MKNGFQVEIQKNLTVSETNKAETFVNYWIGKTCENNLTYYLGGRTGGYDSYLLRNRFGYMDNSLKEDMLVFRRISSKKRIFGVVKVDTMVNLDGSSLRLNWCMCPEHRGGMRVKWVDVKPKTFTYAIIGNIGN